MKKLLALLLCVLMALSMLAACANDDDEEEEKKTKGYTVGNMTVYLEKGFKSGEDSGTFYTDDITVTVMCADNDEDFDSSKEAAREYMEAMAEYADDPDSLETGKKNGVYYVLVPESSKVIGYYVDGDDLWTVEASAGDFDEYEDDLIAYATSGKLDDGSGSEDEDDDDSDNGGNYGQSAEVVAGPEETRADRGTEEYEIGNMRIELSTEFCCDSSDDEYGVFYSDDINVYIYVSENYGDYASSKAAANGDAEGIAQYMDDPDSVEVGKNNGVYYILIPESSKVIGYYVDGDELWCVEASAWEYDAYLEELINIATSGELI